MPSVKKGDATADRIKFVTYLLMVSFAIFAGVAMFEGTLSKMSSSGVCFQTHAEYPYLLVSDPGICECESNVTKLEYAAHLESMVGQYRALVHMDRKTAKEHRMYIQKQYLIELLARAFADFKANEVEVTLVRAAYIKHLQHKNIDKDSLIRLEAETLREKPILHSKGVPIRDEIIHQDGLFTLVGKTVRSYEEEIEELEMIEA